MLLERIHANAADINCRSSRALDLAADLNPRSRHLAKPWVHRRKPTVRVADSGTRFEKLCEWIDWVLAFAVASGHNLDLGARAVSGLACGIALPGYSDGAIANSLLDCTCLNAIDLEKI